MTIDRLKKVHDKASPDKIMPGAAPIFFDQGTCAFLFLHGFTGSTYEGREFALHLVQKGYAVWVPLLPGHGTRPENLKDIAFAEWIDAAEAYYLEMKTHYSKVIVCGQSMGGALALILAAKHQPEGVVTLAAAATSKKWLLKAVGVAGKMFRYRTKSGGPDIKDPVAKSKAVCYRKYPLSSLEEFLKLVSAAEETLDQITCPALLAHSRNDHVIPYQNLEFIASHLASESIELVSLDESYHIISVDVEKQRIFSAVETFAEGICRCES